MNLTSQLNKLTKNAGTLATVGGFLTGSGGGLESVINSLQNAAQGNIHLPDFATMANQFAYSPQLRTALMTAIAGFVIDVTDLPVIGKYGKTLTDVGIGYGLGSLAHWLLYFATHSNLGSDPTKPGYNPNWNKQFDNAKTIVEAQRYYR